MPVYNQIVTSANKKFVTRTSTKGFFSKIAETLGFAQKEVLECRGKSLREMAAITSRKDAVTLSKSTIEAKKECIEKYKSRLTKQREIISANSKNARKCEEEIKECQAKLKELETNKKDTRELTENPLNSTVEEINFSYNSDIEGQVRWYTERLRENKVQLSEYQNQIKQAESRINEYNNTISNLTKEIGL